MPEGTLPVFDCLRRSVLLAAQYPWRVLQAFWPAYLVSAVWHLGNGASWPVAAQLALAPLFVVTTIPCACAWHRNVIHAENVRLTLGRREWNFLKAAAIVVLMYLAVFIPILFLTAVVARLEWSILPSRAETVGTIIGMSLVTISYVTASWFAAPMTLALPAAAIGQPLNTSRAGRLGEPHRLRLTLATLTIPAAMAAFRSVAHGLDHWASAVGLVLDVFAYPTEIGVLSLAFAWIAQAAVAAEAA